MVSFRPPTIKSGASLSLLLLALSTTSIVPTASAQQDRIRKSSEAWAFGVCKVPTKDASGRSVPGACQAFKYGAKDFSACRWTFDPQDGKKRVVATLGRDEGVTCTLSSHWDCRCPKEVDCYSKLEGSTDLRKETFSGAKSFWCKINEDKIKVV